MKREDHCLKPTIVSNLLQMNGWELNQMSLVNSIIVIDFFFCWSQSYKNLRKIKAMEWGPTWEFPIPTFPENLCKNILPSYNNNDNDLLVRAFRYGRHKVVCITSNTPMEGRIWPLTSYPSLVILSRIHFHRRYPLSSLYSDKWYNWAYSCEKNHLNITFTFTM